ncbi:MAG: alpha/beta fold hydrolase [Elusimicrobia bacterium]|nr:alpha/beta fold hydrolase [Elusimicrobiota bacterium]
MRLPVWNAELEYDDTGAQEGPAIIFVHAFPLNRKMWAPQESLKAHARLVSYDARGFGKSKASDAQIPFELYVDDLLALVDRVDADETILCGLSMGGYVALRAAERAAEKISALILADTKSEADGDEAKLKRASTVLSIKKQGLGAFADVFVKSVLAPRSLQKPALVASVKGMIQESDPTGVCAALLAMAGRTDTTAVLRKLTMPSLVLVGAHDAVTPPSNAQALVRGLQRSRLTVIPEAGHMSNLENPDTFNSLVSEFLGEI